jgi:hypothetical protein
MRFMLLIKATPEFEAGTFPDEKTLAEMAQWTAELEKQGKLLECARLRPSSEGVRVRCSGGKVTHTDGPFAETKELIGGLCLIEAGSREEAVEWARRVPFASGEIEVRPLFEISDFPVDPAESETPWREQEEQRTAAPPPQRRLGSTRYLGMLKADADTEAGKLPDPAMMAAMGAFVQEGIERGVLLAGEGLKPSQHGVRVRFAGRERLVTDGPFTETKELVAGYALLQFASREEALDWTKRFVQVDAPGRLGQECECELRPCVD